MRGLSSDGDGAEIIDLFPGAEKTDADAPLRTRPRDPDAREVYCRHLRLELDMKPRRVYCRDCAQEIPAFDALNTLRGEWESYVTARRTAKRQARAANERLAELQRQERNVKARVRRLRSRLPPSLDVREIDYVDRFLRHHRPPRTILDSLLARLQAMRNEIEPQ